MIERSYESNVSRDNNQGWPFMMTRATLKPR